MPINIAINGFGRIGRLTLRALLKQKEVHVVAINDLVDNDTMGHLFKYDSAQGVFPAAVRVEGDTLRIGRQSILALTGKDPASLPWKKLKVDVVLECTGVFKTRKSAGLHLQAGARRVLISAPAKGGGVKTIVLGVNHEQLCGQDLIVSNASCTTNCLAPVVKIIDENWGFTLGTMTTTHAYTATQNLQDAPHKDPRRARAAAFNIIPTSTGAASALATVYPAVAGKISAIAMRVPVITGSLIELNVMVEKNATVDQINQKFRASARGKLRGILEYSEDPLVSSDIIGNPHSSIFDSQLTSVMGKMVKVVSWYDNEAGYAARLGDLAVKLGKLPRVRQQRKP